jgi:hypothetical protein
MSNTASLAEEAGMECSRSMSRASIVGSLALLRGSPSSIDGVQNLGEAGQTLGT